MSNEIREFNELITMELMMINSAEEFVRLRLSENMEEYLNAAWDEASLEIKIIIYV